MQDSGRDIILDSGLGIRNRNHGASSLKVCKQYTYFTHASLVNTRFFSRFYFGLKHAWNFDFFVSLPLDFEKFHSQTTLLIIISISKVKVQTQFVLGSFSFMGRFMSFLNYHFYSRMIVLVKSSFHSP